MTLSFSENNLLPQGASHVRVLDHQRVGISSGAFGKTGEEHFGQALNAVN